MQRLAAQGRDWSKAASQIKVVAGDAAEILRQMAANGQECPDVVYLNPCMDLRHRSPEDAMLHRLASLEPISSEAFEVARECAKSRVVLRHPKALALPFGLDEASPHVTRIPGDKSDFIVYEK
eukprot:gnl/TRDRNA2_/TRDRNA2_93564_c0_seq1.p2 gnl/TRDRNA2_/TRDRNA2_93564_c0~~gnl/TRDRNA2_/TRDRNA2_93564_c0_seq1.p2  ORF type:complete len:123 (+),score=15.98 gnl/TRDRNA2_/TRDRNA2_93564_c0_seq1:125-493(+)